MHTLLIADDDTHFINHLTKELYLHPNYELVSEASDGQDALNKIEQFRPDIVLLDIILPELDGVYIANHIRNHMPDYNPHIYILSSIGTNRIISLLNALNIDFYSMKPVSSAVIIKNLDKISCRDCCPLEFPSHFLQTSEELHQTDISDQIETLLIKLGLPYHHKSAKYIKAAINYCLEHPNGTQLITKRLYPDVAKQCEIAPSAVERSIRHGIHRMHTSNLYTYQRMFRDKYNNDRVTNREFLTVISEYLTQEHL